MSERPPDHTTPVVFYVLSTAAFIGSIASITFIFVRENAHEAQINAFFDVIGITIGALSLIATFAFIVYAFGIWSEQEKIYLARQEILTLKSEMEAEFRDEQKKILLLREKLESEFSTSGVFESLMLYNNVIRYIGMPLWDEDSADSDEDDTREPAHERVDRHVSMTRLLMSILATDVEKQTDVYLAQCRDAVGHLRAGDDEIFFEFFDRRLDAVIPKHAREQDQLDAVRREYHARLKSAERYRVLTETPPWERERT